jgi:putative hydrolase of the HAD superfamily
MGAPALLLDLGGTVFRSGSEMLALLGEAHPSLRDVVARRGPLGPVPDPEWGTMIDGGMTEREYWTRRCAEVGAALGRDWSVPEFMTALFSGTGEDLVRPGAAALVADARAAGVPVGVLTNDLRAFHGDATMAAHPLLREVDALVDASVTGILKPDPRAYALGAQALGREPEDIVFVDDMPWAVRGAREAGMVALQLDLTDPEAVWPRVRAALHLPAVV